MSATLADHDERHVDGLRFYQRRRFRLVALHAGAVDRSRATLKPEIPEVGEHGIPLRDELELWKELDPMSPMKAYRDVDAYLADQPSDVRAVLEKVRRAVKATAPAATEKISYGSRRSTSTVIASSTTRRSRTTRASSRRAPP